MDDFRPEVAYSGIGGSGYGATVVGEVSGARKGSGFMPGGTSLGGGSRTEVLAERCASGGEMDDFRPEVAYSGSGESGFGATVVEEASESNQGERLPPYLTACLKQPEGGPLS